MWSQWTAENDDLSLHLYRNLLPPPPSLITTYGLLDLRYWNISFIYSFEKQDALGIQ